MNKLVFSASRVSDPDGDRVKKLMGHQTKAEDLVNLPPGTAKLRCLKCGDTGDSPSVSAMVFLNKEGEWEVDHIIGDKNREETAGLLPFTYCTTCGPGADLEACNIEDMWDSYDG